MHAFVISADREIIVKRIRCVQCDLAIKFFATGTERKRNIGGAAVEYGIDGNRKGIDSPVDQVGKPIAADGTRFTVLRLHQPHVTVRVKLIPVGKRSAPVHGDRLRCLSRAEQQNAKPLPAVRIGYFVFGNACIFDFAFHRVSQRKRIPISDVIIAFVTVLNRQLSLLRVQNNLIFDGFSRYPVFPVK